jgi:hypothetical protein
MEPTDVVVWLRVTVVERHGWHAQYYSDQSFSWSCANTYEDSTYIFKFWGGDAPGGCPGDHFSARFTRTVSFQGGHYTFHVDHDDGARLYVDDRLIVDAWNDCSLCPVDGGIDLSSGNHVVRVDYYENGGEANLAAWWSGPGALPAKQTRDTNQWYGEYWGNNNLMGTPAVARNEGVAPLDREYGEGGPGYGLPSDNFSARWRRTVDLVCGHYAFDVSTDDGVRLWVGDRLLVDQWQPHWFNGRAEIDLLGGDTEIKMEYFEAGGGAGAHLGWNRVSSCDTQAPTGSVQINSGAAYARSTGVTLNLSAADPGSGVAAMRIRNSNTATWSAARAYSTSAAWTLPAGDGSKTVYVQYQDRAGNWSAAYGDGIYLDTSLPVAGAPVQTVVADTQLGASTVPVRVAWGGSDTGSGVAQYQVQQKRYISGAWQGWTWLSSGTTASATNAQMAGGTYQLQVRAQDKAGNWGAWKPGAQFTVSPYKETSTAADGRVAYSGAWTSQSLSSAYGGYTKYATAKGSYAAFSFTGGKQVAWVAPKASDRGYAEVYLDGVKVASVDLYSASEQPRKVVFARAGLNPSVAHTLKVYVPGTKRAASAGTRVDVDAFVVVR